MCAAVITTIQELTRAVVKLVQKLADCGGLLVVAGDKMGPTEADPHQHPLEKRVAEVLSKD